MQRVEGIPELPLLTRRPWQEYGLDTVLAVVCPLLLTGVMYSARLYPTVPDIAVVYLVLILPLAIWRSGYAAVLAACVASLSFDFFLVPPFYTFTIERWQEWVSLLIFLLTALLVSLLAAQVRRRGEEARQREREARILYELMRVTNAESELDDQLDAIVLALTHVFAAWGVRECALLLAQADGSLSVRADAPIRVEEFKLTREEMQEAQKLLRGEEQVKDMTDAGQTTLLRLVQLRARGSVLGGLGLRIAVQGRSVLQDRFADSFFQAFLDQLTSLVERALLRTQVRGPL